MAGIRLVDSLKKAQLHKCLRTLQLIRRQLFELQATIAEGDILFVNGSTGGTMTQSIHTVVSNTGTVVDVSDGTTISQTDSD